MATAQTFNFFTPGAGVRGFSILRTAARYGERLVSHDATFRLLSGLRSWFFRRVIPISRTSLARYRKGELLDRLVADIDALDQLYLRLISPLIAAVVVTLLLALFLSFFSHTIALVVFCIMGLWMIAMPLVFYRAGKRTGESMGVCQSALRQRVLDYLQGMTEQQVYGCDQTSRTTMADCEQRLINDQSRMASLEGLGSALFVAGSGAAALFVLYLATGEMTTGAVSGPVVVMMMFAVLASFEALMPLPMAFQFLSHTRHAAGRLQQVVGGPVVTFPAADSAIEKGQPLTGDVYFDGVSCGYQHGKNVLHDLSLTIPAGTHVALLGKTGCGKSTLIKLLSRELDATVGKVSLGGHSVESLTESTLFKTITFVPQKTHVFSATLRDNLQIAQPNADDETLLTVVHKTGLDGLAVARDGEADLLDVWLGQGGLSLSGGEQRRLAIARGLLKPAPVLVLDEPGEGLDVHSEQALIKIVLEHCKNCTVIMITHKATVLSDVRQVYRIEDGRCSLVSQK